MKTPDSNQKQPRLLTANAPGLPADFAVLESDDPYDACDEARIIFMANPGVSLVVWSNAPAIFGENATPQQQAALKDAVRNLSRSVVDVSKQIKTKINFTGSFFSPMDDDPSEASIARHFQSIANFTHTEGALLKDWQCSTYELTDALSESLLANKIELATRFKSAAHDYDGRHLDNGLRSNSLRVLRIIDGETTRFYSRTDEAGLRFNRGHTSILLKEGAQAWTMKPWDVAFVSQNVTHEAPRGAQSDRRALEVYDVRSSEEFVAGARRPFFRNPFSRPAFAELDL